MKKFEIKVFHESTTVDKVWLEVIAKTREEAIQQVKDGNYEWMDSKQIDTISGEFIDEDEWEVVEEEPYPQIPDEGEEEW